MLEESGFKNNNQKNFQKHLYDSKIVFNFAVTNLRTAIFYKRLICKRIHINSIDYHCGIPENKREKLFNSEYTPHQ